MDESDFSRLADATLSDLTRKIEDELLDAIEDVELREGVMNIELEDGRAYVINKHAPNRQIWMSSPISGAWRFGYDGDGDASAPSVWVAAKDGSRLGPLLATELAQATGEAFELD